MSSLDYRLYFNNRIEKIYPGAVSNLQRIADIPN